MKTLNFQERIEKAVEQCSTYYELPFEIVDEIMKLDPMVFDVQKRWAGYGTWKVSLFANKYTFGEELSEILQNITIITHDEEKDFVVADLEDEIRDCVENFIYLKWE